MADLVPTTKKPRMTSAEVQKALIHITLFEKGVRFMLLELFEREAHVVMRCGNFPQFCREYMGAKYGDSYVYQLLHAARVERALDNAPTLDLSNLAEFKKPKLSIAATYEIAKLPEDKWAQVYAEYQLRDKHGNRTPGDLLTELKRIVKRELSQAKPPAETQAIAPAQEARTPPDMTPIVPETYDGAETTPEQAAATEAWLDRGLSDPAKVEEENPDERGRPEDTEEEFDSPQFPETPEVEESAAPAASVSTTAAEKPAAVAIQDADPVRTMGISFMKTFDAAMRAGDKDALMELHIDVRRFRKEYGL